ncbi:hypothetical protein BDY19DRAFT_896743 [Irpex rosettiformis]|uniref:Uncharacterized protein n=1 Tax=Irpex rosettiformis TaxID=378272 RepID=A0ACB8TTV4_9APHY|nr:hypothetical protein BDY19DRAFT_896743 [Irpex rosettiformis]
MVEENGNESEPRVWYAEAFPEDRKAGTPLRQSPTAFEQIRDSGTFKVNKGLGPFKDREEWELAKWLTRNVGHTAGNQFLKLPTIRSKLDLSFKNQAQLLEAIDQLPSGPEWKCQSVTVAGDQRDVDGEALREELELWFRNPIECIRELIGNPLFVEKMVFTPEKVFEDSKGEEEVRNEMNTGKWWWEIQMKLPVGATVVPVILSSDKTRLSQFRGDKSAWPVYLTIGNIDKETRRQSSSHATVLLGYIPVPKLDCCSSDNLKKVTRYTLFHQCMRVMLDSLVEAGSEGVEMTCADGQVRKVWPILAAYVADYPEQCLVACCMENRCPICKVEPDLRGAHQSASLRTEAETLQLLRQAQTDNLEAPLKAFGIRPIWSPFWKDLPHTEIFRGFTPDLLHQLLKGVFKDHLVKWCTALIGEDELDARFRTMPTHHNLRHFKHGISSVSQWTGREHKEMVKVFVGALSGAVEDRVIEAVKSIVDFICLSSLHSHSRTSVRMLRQALDNFHATKSVFVELEARSPAHFNIPKIHSMDHYVDLIETFGSADGYNTESPERLHIDYAKDAYRASNKRDYVPQMVNWLRRQEAIDYFEAYLEWCQRLSSAVCVTHSHSSTPPTAQFTASHSTARRPPRHLRDISAEQIIEGHNASEFLPAIQHFLRSHGSNITPRLFDRFDLFKQLSIKLPIVPEVSKNHCRDLVRAFPPVTSSGRHRARSAYLDFALVRTPNSEHNPFTMGTALSGLRVAQVKAIFCLPPHFTGGQSTATEPLAYIEWLTPFRAHNGPNGLMSITRSTRMHRPHAEIILVDRIVRSCHLIPHFGRTKEPGWTSENVAELCRVFWFNHYLDFHIFAMLMLRRRDCI